MVRSVYLYSSIVFAVCLSYNLSAQYFEGGVMLGGSAYEGDLAPSELLEKFKNIRPSFGVFVRQNVNKNWAGRVSFQYGTLVGADLEERAYRNLSFSSVITELSATVEYSWPGYDPAAFLRLSPYAFAGLGYFHFNPKTEFQGQEVELRNLGTEGQGLDGYGDFYSQDQIAFILGAGLKYAPTPSVTIALEFGGRRTTTDYLDDVSGNYASYRDLAQARGTFVANLADRAWQLNGGEPSDVDRGGMQRGNPAQKDWYFIGNLTISYHFYDLIGGKGTGCPRW